MSAHDANRPLLFGLFALQNGFVTRDGLVAAFGAWVADKSRPLDAILVEQGHLDPRDRSILLPMVERHIEKHQGDPEKSLASLAAGRSTHEALGAIADPDIDATLTRVGTSTTQPDADRTVTYSIGSATSAGQRFLVLRPHAKGGLGEVFVARDNELNREVALKQILPSHADDDTSRHRFVIEAEITGGLEHPGIVPVYGLGSDSTGRPFYAMRFIRGDSLKQAIARFHGRGPRSHPLPPGEGGRRPGEGPRGATSTASPPSANSLELRKLLRRFLDVCNAIEYAHARGVLHRDIKPGNIIVGNYGETLVVDWGLAKATGHSDPASPELTLVPTSASGSAETLPGCAIGTPAYMSPEQAAGRLDQFGPASDVYGLGATLYVLLTGKAPFEGDIPDVLRAVQRGEFRPPRQIDSGLSKSLEAICLKAMALKPDDRYASARALGDDLERWLADEPVTARPEPLAEKARRWTRKHRTLVTSAVAALAVAAIGLGAVSAAQTKARNDLAAKNVALDQQRRRAEDREQLAINAVKKFRDAVVDEPLLKNTPDLEKLRTRLLNEPLTFFRELREQLQSQNDTRPESLQRLASAAFDLGLLINEIGDKRGAIRAFEATLKIQERLAREHPTVTDYAQDLAMTHNNLGVLLSATGDPAGARRSYEETRDIQERLSREHPTVTTFDRDRAATITNLGNLLIATGDSAGARRAYEAALDIQERLARENSDRHRLRPGAGQDAQQPG